MGGRILKLSYDSIMMGRFEKEHSSAEPGPSDSKASVRPWGRFLVPLLQMMSKVSSRMHEVITREERRSKISMLRELQVN